MRTWSRTSKLTRHSLDDRVLTVHYLTEEVQYSSDNSSTCSVFRVSVFVTRCRERS